MAFVFFVLTLLSIDKGDLQHNGKQFLDTVCHSFLSFSHGVIRLDANSKESQRKKICDGGIPTISKEHGV